MGLSSGVDLEVWHGRPRARPIPSRVSVASRERLSILESTPVKGAIPSSSYTRLHLRFGWWSLLLFAALGLALETLQGFKVPLYVDVSSDTRRLMWTLAHAHGVGLALVHLLFALSLPVLPPQPVRDRMVSRCLIAASMLLPGGFFAGGLVYYGGDPGPGILLVPVGAVLLLAAVFALARATKQMDPGATRPGPL
jgi:hypothetical protein